MSLAPPFTEDTARAKVKKAQDLWNAQDPKVIAQAYTSDSIWRNRTSFVVGTAAIEDFLTKKWEKEKSYTLRKELFAFSADKIAVQFWYEFQDAHDGMKWKRCYGLEDWTFAADGKMRKRQMSGNDVDITEAGKRHRFQQMECIPSRFSMLPKLVHGKTDNPADRWFKDGVDVEKVAISEAHW